MISFVEIIGNSMEPVLKNGQFAIFVKSFKIKRDQIVIFNYQNKKFVKRVIGLPGEIIRIDDKGCSINDNIVYPSKNSSPVTYEWILEDSQYILLGDNSEDSLDSRKLGPINKSEITHKMLLKIPKR